MDLGLKGKTALVTGASEGIGKAIARPLAEEGERVVEQAAGRLGGKDVADAGCFLV